MAVSQSVKEVLQSLVDDGLVQTDKVGSSNCASGSLRRIDGVWFVGMLTELCAYMHPSDHRQSSGASRRSGGRSYVPPSHLSIR